MFGSISSAHWPWISKWHNSSLVARERVSKGSHVSRVYTEYHLYNFPSETWLLQRWITSLSTIYLINRESMVSFYRDCLSRKWIVCLVTGIHPCEIECTRTMERPVVCTRDPDTYIHFYFICSPFIFQLLITSGCIIVKFNSYWFKKIFFLIF